MRFEEGGEEMVGKPVEDWWSTRPMTYGTEHGTAHYKVGEGQEVDYSPGSAEFFQQIDRTINDWNRPLHEKTAP